MPFIASSPDNVSLHRRKTHSTHLSEHLVVHHHNESSGKIMMVKVTLKMDTRFETWYLCIRHFRRFVGPHIQKCIKNYIFKFSILKTPVYSRIFSKQELCCYPSRFKSYYHFYHHSWTDPKPKLKVSDSIASVIDS